MNIMNLWVRSLKIVAPLTSPALDSSQVKIKSEHGIVVILREACEHTLVKGKE